MRKNPVLKPAEVVLTIDDSILKNKIRWVVSIRWAKHENL